VRRHETRVSGETFGDAALVVDIDSLS
jgi:hypothetical protein